MLLVAVLFMLLIEILHLRGAFLEDPFLWLLVAMVNFLRLRNDYRTVKGLRITCIGANLIVLTVEIVRYGMYGNALLRSWGPYTLIAGIAALGETIFSMMQAKELQ
jgi:hypothetical protein